MNKRDLVEEIAAGARLTKAQAGLAIDALVSAIKCSLVKGERVTLAGFGTFAVARRRARRVRDPRRGTTMQIRARSVARFAPGLELKMAIESAEILHGTDHLIHSRPS